MPATIVSTKQISIPAFLANNTAVQAGIAATAFTKVALQNVQYDIGSNFNTSTYRFIAPVAGIYTFTGSVSYSNDTGRCIASLFKNGVEAWRGGNGQYTGTGNRAFVAGDISLAAGDYVELWGWRNEAGSFSFDGNFGSAFAGHLVVAT